MTSNNSNNPFSHDLIPATGVLLSNLGTPSAASVPAVRQFLKEFLSDPRVVEIPPLLWKVLLFILLRNRPKFVTRSYQAIWTEQGSPLMVHSIAQQAAIQELLSSQFNGPIRVKMAMRYGEPSLEKIMNEFKQENVQRILVLPLYPQYSATTTASTFDEITRILKTWRWIPEMRFINQYHDFKPYIDTLAKSINDFWTQHQKPEKLILSFHGLPKRNLEKGDPYFCQCFKTARLLTQALNLKDSDWQMSFQSRLGRLEWLTPATDKVMVDLAKEGIKNVHVVCPGFSADNLETLEEVDMQYRELFLDSGGTEYHYIPALNSSPDHIKMLSELIQQHSQNWPEFSSSWDPTQHQQDAVARQQHATTAGALK